MGYAPNAIPNTSILAGYKKARSFAENAFVGRCYVDVVDGERMKGRPRFYHVHDVAVIAEQFIEFNKKKGGPEYSERLLIILAYLHDLFEDTNVHHTEVIHYFNKDIANGVQAMTKNKKLPKESQMEDSLKRILAQPPEVAIVKMCDRICNLQRTKKIFSKEKRKEYAEESILIAKMLGKANHDVFLRLSSCIKWYANDISKGVCPR